MSNEMKLIMENWRRSVVIEVLSEQQEDPETVEDLLKGLNAYIISKSDKVKRVAAAIANALSKAGDIADETILEITENTVQFIQSIAENGVYETIKEMGKDFIINLAKKIASDERLRKFFISKIGEEGIKFITNQIAPAAMSLYNAAKWIIKVFNISKDLKQAYDEGTADVNKVFSNIMQDIMTAPDNKDTTAGFLGLFNIDDEWQKMLDDKIEIKFINKMVNQLKSTNPATPLDQLNFNQQLIDFLKDEFEGRTVTK
jgi:uncharacterized protein Yka (UPF0111/DUF47 family)